MLPVRGALTPAWPRQMDAKPELRAEICARVHELDPRVPASPADVHLLRDIIAFRPGRRSGLRVERELIDGIKVVHAYGAYSVWLQKGMRC